jgi:hypothetical protein
MNEALRLLRRILRGRGYDLRKIKDYDLAQLTTLGALDDAGDVTRTQAQLSETADAPDGDRLDRLLVCLRTCIRGDPNRPSGRITGASVQENVLRCLASTVESVNRAVAEHGAEAVEMVVFDDHSEASAVARLRGVLANLTCAASLTTNRERGQGASLLEHFEFAKGRNSLVYFCEDDYLHAPAAIPEMWDFYKTVHARNGRHMVLYPVDYPDRYKTHYPSYVLLGRGGHWRSISHATHTLFTHGAVVARHWDYFYGTRLAGSGRGGQESKTTNLLFDHIPGFSAIPSLACHLQSEATLPPFFDWKALWERYDPSGDGDGNGDGDQED